MLRIRLCIVVAWFSSALLACDDTDPDSLDSLALERSGSDPEGWLRVLDDPQQIVTAEDLELQIVIDPASLPKDIAGIGETTAMVLVGSPSGTALKVKLKVIFIPAYPPADG